MSGRLREYDATRPATMPAASNTPNIATRPMMRKTRPERGGPGGGLRARVRARGRAALRATSRSRKYAVDEPAGIFGRELPCQLDGFVDHDGRRRFGAVLHLEDAHPQHDPVDRRQPLDG